MTRTEMTSMGQTFEGTRIVPRADYSQYDDPGLTFTLERTGFVKGPVSEVVVRVAAEDLQGFVDAVRAELGVLEAKAVRS